MFLCKPMWDLWLKQIDLDCCCCVFFLLQKTSATLQNNNKKLLTNQPKTKTKKKKKKKTPKKKKVKKKIWTQDITNLSSVVFLCKELQPSQGHPDSLSHALRSPVSPCTGGKHKAHLTFAAGAVKICSTESQEVTDFMSPSQRQVLLPPARATAMAGEWHWTPLCGFQGNQWNPQVLGDWKGDASSRLQS